ncbi:MAG: hypothetical protein V3W45_04995, partial [Sedimentisphaerales bacterium]
SHGVKVKGGLHGGSGHLWEVGFWAENGGEIKKEFENPVVTTIDRIVRYVRISDVLLNLLQPFAAMARGGR